MRRNDDAFADTDDYIYIDIPTPTPMTVRRQSTTTMYQQADEQLQR